MGEVESAAQSPAGVRLTVRTPAGFTDGVKPGDSVCTSGVCLTHAPGEQDSQPGRLVFDVIPETLEKTTLGALKAGGRVNLERSLRADGMLDGHLVQGHVEGACPVVRVEQGAEEHRVAVRAPRELMECITPKGSVTIDGVSLTVAAVDVAADEFEVALIPTTLGVTTLGLLSVGSLVNIETDIVGRAAVHWLRHYGSASTRS